MPILRSAAAASVMVFSVAFSMGCSGTVADPTEAPAADNDEDFGDELKTKTDAAIQAEIKAAAAGTVYVSEADYEFSMVKASLPDGTRAITEAIVRDKLAWSVDHDENADKPLAKLFAQSNSWAEWKTGYGPSECGAPGEAPDAQQCAKTQAMIDVLSRNLRGIKVFYFGAHGSRGNVDGTGVSIIVVGRTPKGNLAGVRTVAIWT